MYIGSAHRRSTDIAIIITIIIINTKILDFLDVIITTEEDIMVTVPMLILIMYDRL